MKRLISLLLAVAILVLSLAGCSADNKNKHGEMILKNTYDSIYSDFDDSTIRAYDDVCNAVISGETEIRFNTSMLEDVLQLFYTSFPLSFLVKEISQNLDGSGVTISYKYEPEEHLEKVYSFNDKIIEIENECGISNSTDGVYMLNAYHYVSSHIKISENTGVSVYETIMSGEGSVFTYANMFEYLLQQKGIMAFHIIATDKSGAGWGLSSAQLNGGIYYFDVGREFYSSRGENIIYFAMNFSDLKNAGIKSIQYTSQSKAFKSKENDFSACRQCSEWSLDGNKLKIKKHNNEDIVYELK